MQPCKDSGRIRISRHNLDLTQETHPRDQVLFSFPKEAVHGSQHRSQQALSLMAAPARGSSTRPLLLDIKGNPRAVTIAHGEMRCHRARPGGQEPMRVRLRWLLAAA